MSAESRDPIVDAVRDNWWNTGRTDEQIRNDKRNFLGLTIEEPESAKTVNGVQHAMADQLRASADL